MGNIFSNEMNYHLDNMMHTWDGNKLFSDDVNNRYFMCFPIGLQLLKERLHNNFAE